MTDSATTVGTVHVVVPPGIDDPARPSGGNTYDRQLCTNLAAIGWEVRVQAVAGSWPRPDRQAHDALDRAIAGIPDDAFVLVDGLIASAAPTVLRRHADRLRLAILMHMAFGDVAPADELATIRAAECATLSAAGAVIAPSSWARQRLVELYGLPPGRIHVAEPGVEAAELALGTVDGGELLCVAAVAPHKGHDVLLAALTELAERPWHCVCVGSLELDPDFVAVLRGQALAGGIADRVDFVGPLTGGALSRAYAAADVLVLASGSESYGMVVTEALARGTPVIAGAVGGVPEALGWTQAGRSPGLLIPPNDPHALSEALTRWLSDAVLRGSLRSAAQDRRRTLHRWDATARSVASVLLALAGSGVD
ncbi:MAG: glycosyltransferase family 4 protein [Mycobacterium sp.]|nr:glycosyltransferase family 4 protein [Mycobacterium sp.]